MTQDRAGPRRAGARPAWRRSLITSLVLLAAGDPVLDVWDQILSWPEHRNIVNIINNATVLYLSGLAAAIGFRMNLFNIGVDGPVPRRGVRRGRRGRRGLAARLPQHRRWRSCARWSSVRCGPASPASCGSTRGRQRGHLDDHAERHRHGLVAYLLRKVAVRVDGSNAIDTKTIPEGSRVPSISIGHGQPQEIYGFVVLAVVVGVAFWVLLNRTRFGFDLRATGRSTTAAVASGVNVKQDDRDRDADLGRGGRPGRAADAVRRLATHYGSTFQTGLGFTGIAVALLGRNNPIGIAFGALIFAFLNEQSNLLQILVGVSPDIVAITQGVIVLTVVIAYEVVRRYRRPPRAAGGGRAASATRALASPRRWRHERRPRPPPAHRSTAPPAEDRAGVPRWALIAAPAGRAARAWPCWSSHRRRRPDVVRHAGRDPDRRPCRSCWPVSAASGPSAPAWSTSASRA